DAGAAAFVADDFDGRENLRVDADGARAFAGVAAPSRGIEGEHSRRHAVQPGGGRFGEKFSNLVPRFDVGRRIRSRRTSDGRLIDKLNVVDLIDAFQRLDLANIESADAAILALIAVVEAIANERRLSRSGNAGDRDELSERNRDVDVFEIVLAGAHDSQG